ncbi:MAG: acyl-CoA dehydrogenase family protein [Lapillicoccus sp.]
MATSRPPGDPKPGHLLTTVSNVTGAEAAHDEHVPVDVSQQVRALVSAPLPLPGGGQTVTRWDALAAAARQDVVVGRLLEAHADADAILAEVAGRRVSPRQWWGVWAAEPPAPVVIAERGAHGWVLSGTKSWCSGAGLCTHALVTVRVGQERPLFAVDLSHPGVSVDLSGWQPAGMRRSATGAVTFDGVPADPVGSPADYLERPGFWHGGAGVAACWLGGAERVADTLRRAGARFDDHAAAHLGAVDAVLAAARWSLHAAAAEVDARPQDVHTATIRALRVRAVVEAAAAQTLDRVGRALGATPLATDAAHTTAVADLLVYLRQSHAERDLAALGRLVGDPTDRP